jgi:RND family efflux transporter MFP subunit
MNAFSFRTAGAITLAVAGTLLVAGCNRSHAEAHAPAPQLVRVVEIDTHRSAAAESRQYTGIVRARIESSLGFRVAGKISERLVDAGERVKKDQPLLKLDPVDYELGLESARAAVEAARAVHIQTSLELERVHILVEKKAEPRDALERATAAAESAAAQLRSAEAQANRIANQASYATLLADSDGIVMNTLAEPGQVVAAGQPVIILAKDGPREAAIDIPEHALALLREQAATARLYLNPEVAVPATLRELSGVADPVARTFQARYVLNGDPTDFPLGATVTVRVSTSGESTSTSAEIPLGSLIDRGDGAAVWIVDPHTSTIQKRAVSLAKLGAETAWVSRGLGHGDLVVALGAPLLNAGQTVRMVRLSAKEAK